MVNILTWIKLHDGVYLNSDKIVKIEFSNSYDELRPFEITLYFGIQDDYYETHVYYPKIPSGYEVGADLQVLIELFIDNLEKAQKSDLSIIDIDNLLFLKEK